MEKRDKIGIIIWLCVMLAATVGIEIRERWTWRLFGDLQQEDVVSIDVIYGVPSSYQLSPPYKILPPYHILPPYQMNKED